MPLLKGSSAPSITFDDNSGGFDFTATAADGGIEFTVAGITNTYRSGAVTYDNNKISVEGGDFTMVGSIYGQAMSADISAEGTIDFEFSATGLTIDGENIDVTLNIGETSQNFEISGKFVNNFASRAISLSEGAVIRSIFEDGTFSVITANADIENLINLNADGFEITSTDSDALTIELTNAEDFSVMTISQIEGTLNYSNDDVLTLSDGTSLNVSVYDYKAKVSTSGNSSTFKVEPERIIYTPGEGATLVFDYYEESVVYTEQGGSIIANYNSFGLSLDGVNLNWSFLTGASDTSADTNLFDQLIYDSSPANDITLRINLDVYGNIHTDNQNGFYSSDQIFLDRIIAHELVHAAMYAEGLMKRKMPQFFTEGVADLIQGNDDFNSGLNFDILNLANDFSSLSSALSFSDGTGNTPSYAAGYMFLRWLAHQSRNTDIVFASSKPESISYHGSNTILSFFDEDDDIFFHDAISAVDFADGDFLISGSTGYLLIRDAAEFLIPLTDYASISADAFSISNANQYLRVGTEFFTLTNASASFALDGKTISNLTGTLSGFAGGYYSINGESVSLAAADSVSGDGSNFTIQSGETYSTGDSIFAGANVSVHAIDDTAYLNAATLVANDVVIFTQTGNITILDGAFSLGEFAANASDSVNITGSDFNDSISNSGDTVLINARNGNDSISNSGDFATINAGDGDDFISLNADNSTVILSAGSNTLAGANSTTTVLASAPAVTTTSGDNVIISNDSATLTVLASNFILAFDIDVTDSNIEINTADGDDSVTSFGDNVSINAGNGANFITVAGSGSLITTADGDDSITSFGDFVSINAGNGFNFITVAGSGSLISTGDVYDLINIADAHDLTIDAGAGDNYIFGYSSDSKILADIAATRIVGNNVEVATTNVGFITIFDAANSPVSFINSDGVEFTISPHDLHYNSGSFIMHDFFDVLSWYSNDTTTSGIDILNQAVRATTLYRDLDDAIDNFIFDLVFGDGDTAEERLFNAAGIVLGGDDTGAASGYNAGNYYVINAEDIVPEPDGIKLSDIETPEAGSTSSYSVTGNDGTVINFSVKWQDSFSVARDFTNGFALTELDDSDTLDYIQYAARGMTLWFPAAVKLAYDSYGVSFDGKLINAFFDVNAPYAALTAPTDKRDYPIASSIDIGLDLSQFEDHPLDPDDPNGNFGASMYLDRILAHELVHAVMYASGTIKESMPEFFTEGVADLVQGDDDSRVADLSNIASDYHELFNSMSLTPGSGGEYTYAAGDAFLRYLFHHNLDTEFAIGTSEDDVFYYSTGDAVVSNFDSNDSIHVIYDDIFSTVQLSNGDRLITSSDGSLLIRGSDATVFDCNGVPFVFTAQDSAPVDGLSISNSTNVTAFAASAYNDSISNSANSVFINARAGHDFISSRGLANSIHGGAGNDTIFAVADSDDADTSLRDFFSVYANGDAGDDFISVCGSQVTVESSAGNDTLRGADSNTVIIVNNPVTISDHLITTDSGSLDFDSGSLVYRFISASNDTLFLGSAANDTFIAFGDNISIDAAGGRDFIEGYDSDTALLGWFDDISNVDFQFSDNGLRLIHADDSILLSGYTGGELNIDGHHVYAVKSGNSVKIDSSVEYYSVASDATLTGLGAGESVTVNGSTFAANDNGTAISSDGIVVWSGNADDLGGINIMALEDSGNTALAMLVDSVLKVNTETGYPDFAAVFFHASEEAAIPDATGYASSETLTAFFFCG